MPTDTESTAAEGAAAKRRGLSAFRPHLHYLKAVRWTFFGALACAACYGVASGFTLPYMVRFVFPKIFSPDAQFTFWQLAGYTLWLPGVFLVRGLSGYGNSYLVNLCGVRVLEAIRVDYFTKLQSLPLAFFHRSSTGDLISRGMADTNQLQVTLTHVASEAFKQPTTLLGALGFLVYLSIKNNDVVFVLVCLAFIPVCVFPIRYIGLKLTRRARQVQQEMGDVTGRFSENLGALKEVRAFNLENREVERFASGIRRLFTFQMKVVKYQHALSPTIEFISALGVSAALLYAYHVRLPLEAFLAIVAALYSSYDPVKKMGMINNELRKGQGALERIEAVLNEPVAVSDPPSPTPLKRARGDLVFENVSFAYVDEPVLREVSVSLPAGTVCALVGPSGAGKTTFAHLVPRFYDPTAGRVTLDGIDLRQLRLADLRSNLALVSQDPVLFNDTIRENIRLGRPGADDAAVEKAARDAYAHEFITGLPGGYDAITGERGTLLSGGQKQRLALARAFLRDAPILILDEATSALDSQSEEAIQAALRKLMAGRTVLIIAHRFSTIRDAHRLLVFDRGRIIAGGTHDDLHATCPLYRTLYDRQAAGPKGTAG